MQITWKTKMERRAYAIRNTQNRNPLTVTEREETVRSLRSIALLAEFASRIIESDSVSITNPFDGDREWLDLDEMGGELWTKTGKERFRLTHAGMALAHDLFARRSLEGSRFPHLDELGFSQR